MIVITFTTYDVGFLNMENEKKKKNVIQPVKKLCNLFVILLIE